MCKICRTAKKRGRLGLYLNTYWKCVQSTISKHKNSEYVLTTHDISPEISKWKYELDGITKIFLNDENIVTLNAQELVFRYSPTGSIFKFERII